MANYPASVTSFSVKNAGDTIQPADINDLQNEVTAIEAGLINGTAHLQSSATTCASLQVTGNSTFAGTLTVAGQFTGSSGLFTSSIACAGGVLVQGILNASGQIQSRDSIAFTGSTTISPGSTGDTHNLAISANVSQVRLNVTGNSTITGLALSGGAFDGYTLMFWNVGAGTATLPHQTGSASTGQWICPQNTAVSLKTNGGILAKYDGTSSMWRILLAS